MDTGIFEGVSVARPQDVRYFDVFFEYAKNSAEDILIQITVVNRGEQEKTLHLLPTLWFRNTWSQDATSKKPLLKVIRSDDHISLIEANHLTLGNRWLYCKLPHELLFTENETNYERLFGVSNPSFFVKDGIDNYVVRGQKSVVNSQQVGTKASSYYLLKGSPKNVR